MRLYFTSPIAYVVVAIFALIAGYFFYSIFAFFTLASMQSMMNPAMARELNVTDSVMRPLFSNISVILLLLMPLVTMRQFAEERRSGTIELLLTYPVRDGAVLAAKYLAALALYGLMLVLTLLYPGIVVAFARLEWGPVATGYVGLLLMGSTFIAVGLFASSLTENQIVASITTFGILLILWIIGWSADYAGGAWGKVLQHLSILEHNDNFAKGVLDTKDVLYYANFIAVALSFVWPGQAHYRGFLLVAGALLVVASLLARIEDYRGLLGRRTTRYGVNAAVMILLVLGVTGLVQALAAQHSWRYDLTENKRFSLSPQTIQLLRTLPTDVSAIGFFRSDQPGKRVAEDLFKQYARYASADRFTWRVVDPDREPALARRYGIEAYGTVVLETKTKSEKILDAEEEKLTNGLVKVTREGKRVVYVIQGHGEHELTNSDRPGFSEAKAALERTNYTVKPLTLAREGKIADDAAVVILAGPRTDLLQPEFDALDVYIGRGGKVLLMVDPFQSEGLRKYLAKYGFVLDNDLVVESNPIGRLFGIGPEVPIVQQYGAHAITREMSGVSTLFPLTRSLSAAAPMPKGVSWDSLARTSEQSWGETNREELQRGVAKPDPADPKGPLTVAAVATKDKARIVVYGTSNLAANQFLNLQGNRDFFLNTVSWLAEEEDQISILPRDARQTPVLLNANQAQLVFLLPVIVVPGLVLAGSVVAVVRRRGMQ